MKKILLALAAVATFGITNAAEIAIDFSNPSSLGVAKAAAGEATVSEGFTFEGVNVTITQGNDYGQSQELRFFTNSSEVVDFRCSATGGTKGHKFTVEYTENIKAIVFEGANTNASKNFNFTATPGTFTAPEWTGDSKTVTFTTTGEVHLKSMTIYTGTTEAPTPTPSDNVFEESFANGLGEFTIENVSMPEALTYVWSADTKYGYVKASAYKDGTSYASESWLISPVITLTADNTLSFDHLYNKFPDLEFAKANCTLNIREEGGAWAALTIPTCSDNASWTFVNSGEINLSAYNGKRVQLGFKYVSEDGKSGTWEVKNLVIKGKAGIAEVEIDANAPVEYYNLLGVRVDEPTAGLYIRRQGKSVTKVLVK